MRSSLFSSTAVAAVAVRRSPLPSHTHPSAPCRLRRSAVPARIQQRRSVAVMATQMDSLESKLGTLASGAYILFKGTAAVWGGVGDRRTPAQPASTPSALHRRRRPPPPPLPPTFARPGCPFTPGRSGLVPRLRAEHSGGAAGGGGSRRDPSRSGRRGTALRRARGCWR
jgi:hypothetical protein